MPGIEFVGLDDDGAGDDLLDAGPHRPWARWVWVVSGLLVAAAVAVVASRSGDDAAPRPSVASTSSSTSTSTSEPPGPLISALTADTSSLYWLAGNRLYRAGPVGRASASAAIDAVADDFVETQLVPDPDERTVWVVSRGASDSAYGSGTAQGFSTADLTRVTSISAPSLIDGAAVFHGALYVLSAGRLLRARGQAFVTIADVDEHARGLVASDAGLFYTEGANSSAIGRWTPGGGVRPPVVLDTTGSSLAVVGDTVFVAGLRAGRDVLSSYRFAGSQVSSKEVATGLTSDLQLVAGGSKSIVALGAGSQGLRLACVRADGGQPAVTTTRATSANVAVLRGIVFEAVGSGVREADLGSCPG